ncbi:hypothetical protein ACFU6S_06315 [Streptomyces sp. NPDC057456]|uniref:hypothetical protein n=1 Tax=Streptomyces sp. NPDC057456 TaxID=3346139 RepID=UPI0036C5301C
MHRIGLVAGSAVAAAALLTGCGGTEDGATEGGSSSSAATESGSSPSAATGEASAGAEDVKVVKSGFEDHEVWGDHAYVIHYEITNHGKGAANYFVGFEFLDADGDALGSTGVSADKLGVGKTNTGDSAPLDAEITNGKIADIKSVRVSTVERTDPV